MERDIFGILLKLEAIVYQCFFNLHDYTFKYISYDISNFRNVSAVFDGYPETQTATDNIHKCHLGKRVFPTIAFEPNMPFQGKKNAFIRNTANQNCIVNVISTKLKKVGCNRFDGADIGILKLVLQSYLRGLIAAIG